MNSMINQNFLATGIGDDHLLCILSWNLKMLYEIYKYLRDLSWLILMNDMADLIEDHQFEFSLHLGNCQFLVHSVAARQQ